MWLITPPSPIIRVFVLFKSVGACMLKRVFLMLRSSMTSLFIDYQVQYNDWRAVFLHQSVEMFSGRPTERIAQLKEDLRLWNH